MKKGTKRFLGFAIPTATLAIAARQAYVKIRYGAKNAKDTIKFSESIENETPEIHLTAHRGLSSVCPENTLEAFKEAAKYNYYALECDVHYTTDGKWVIIHDYMLQSMCEEKGDVKTMSYDEKLSKIRFTNGANIKDFPDARPCLVEEFIEICKEANIRPMIEVKDKRIDKVENLYKIICDYDIEDSVIVISFHKDVLREFRKLSPDMDLWLLVHTITDSKILECIENGNGVAFEAKRANSESIQKIHDANLTAACWTVDTKEMLNEMVKNGVKYITTNAILPE
ncbi:MAG: hypothetical protein IKW45_07915 [Clostridia bacterium]|nr:hypothetical protein [Clostridia bacterium]